VSTHYTNLNDITDLQTRIVIHIGVWVKTEKTPVPRSVIVKLMEDEGVGYKTVEKALEGLLKLGYIRRAIGTSNKTYYVQLRSI
jgi:hypothetical protein